MKKPTIGVARLHVIHKALLVMKLSFLMVLIFTLQVAARVNGQSTVSIKVTNEEIVRVLNIIEKQSDYRFLYNSRLLEIHNRVNLDLNNAGISDALLKIFAGTSLTFKAMDNNLIVVLSNAMLADTTITGKVTNESGEPLSGVSVTINGSTRGTITNNTGDFRISAPDNATLSVSYVGFITQNIPVSGQSVIDVKLVASVRPLDQVVVIGYGTQRKVDVTGSVGHVRGEELAKQPVLTATQALQGQVSGVQVISSGQPGGMPQVIIRGTGSILSGVAPLYVVDGIWTDDITNINTADIASIDVLKDASACSIYGVRGANGVILITTKQGSGKIKVNVSANVGFQQAAYVVPMANATQYINYVQAITGLPVQNTGYSTDWYNEILRKAFYQNYNVSVSGSSAQDRYALSVGYQTDNGIVIFNDYNRATVRFNNEFTPTTFLKIGTTLSFANQNSQNVPTGTVTEDAYRASPLVPAILNGKFGNTSQYQNVGNPVLTAQGIDDLSTNNKLQGNIYVEVKPIKSIAIRSTFGDEYNVYNDRQYTYLQPNDTTFFTTNGGSQGASRSELAIASAQNSHWVWSNTITFNQEFGKSKLTVLAGTESQEYYATSSTASRYNVPAVKSEWYLQNGDQTTQTNGSSVAKYTSNSYLARVIYNYDDRFLFTGSFRADGTSVFAPQNHWGNFPGVSGGWIISHEKFMQNQKIFQYLKLKASWGELGNSNIAPDAWALTTISNIPYFFNSSNTGGGTTNGTITPQIKDVNIQWEITKETDLGFEYSILKGKLTGEFDVYDKRVPNALIYIQVPGTFGSQANPISNITAGDVLTNAASIDNRGLEFSARWHDNINPHFSYFIGGNVSVNQNKVLSLNGGLPFFDGNVNGYFTTETKAGYPIGSFFTRQVIGVFQNQTQIDNYKDKNGDVLQSGAQPGDFIYKYTDNGKLDTVFQGAYQPKLYIGLSGGITFNNFDFSFDIYSNIGNQVYNGKAQARVVSTDNVEKSVATSYWTTQNQSETQPRANGGNLPASSYFIASGTFARINNLTLGYTFPERLLGRQKVISSCRIFASAQNPVTLKKYSGFSAELPSAATVYNGNQLTANTLIPTSTATNSGIEFNTYPTTQTFAFGLNVSF
jgi:TonB-linked SusC/RagA family outer membrane protein